MKCAARHMILAAETQPQPGPFLSVKRAAPEMPRLAGELARRSCASKGEQARPLNGSPRPLYSAMPEGHTIHRLARDHNATLARKRLRVTSPQGRFTDGAKQLD